MPDATLELVTYPLTISGAGLPIQLTLAAAEIGEETYASITTDALADALAGDTFTLGDVVLTAIPTGDEPKYGEFARDDQGEIVGPNFVQALLDTPLVNDYAIGLAYSAPFLIARRPGPAWNLAVSDTSALASLILTAADPRYASQLFPAWGCYVELYAYTAEGDRAYPIDPADEISATLLNRQELPYSEGNRYTFDLAPWLRSYLNLLPELTGDDPASSSRQVAYFVRYGEIYATTGNAYRRRYEAGRWPTTGVAWAFDAVTTVAPSAGFFLTSYRYPRPIRYTPAEAEDESPYMQVVGAIWQASTEQDIAFVVEKLDGTDEEIYTVTNSSDAGGVVFYNFPVFSTEAIGPGVIVRFESRNGVGTVIDTLRFTPVISGSQLLWANRQGGWDSWCFTGAAEPTDKRGLTTYADYAGNTHARQVDLARSTRVYSGLLSELAFTWLTTELAASPAVYLIGPYGTGQAVTVTDVDPKADVVNGEYTIELTITPEMPFTSLAR